MKRAMNDEKKLKKKKKKVPTVCYKVNSNLFLGKGLLEQPNEKDGWIACKPWAGCTFAYRPNFVKAPISTEVKQWLSTMTTWHTPEYRLFGSSNGSNVDYLWIGEKIYVFSRNHINGCPPTKWSSTPKCVKNLLKLVNQTLGMEFNALLIARYNYDGENKDKVKLSWHSDNDKWLLPSPAEATVPCITLATSKNACSWLGLKPKDKTNQARLSVCPMDSSLYIMGQGTQKSSLHSILPSLNPQGLENIYKRTSKNGIRYGLTFRKVDWNK